MNRTHIALQPRFNRNFNNVSSSAFKLNLQSKWHCHFLKIGNSDVGSIYKIAFGVRNVFDGNIELPVIIKPFFPKPVKIFASFIIHRSEKIIRRWMFVSPSLNVLLKSIIKPIVAKYHFPKQNQSKSRLKIFQR